MRLICWKTGFLAVNIVIFITIGGITFKDVAMFIAGGVSFAIYIIGNERFGEKW